MDDPEFFSSFNDKWSFLLISHKRLGASVFQPQAHTTLWNHNAQFFAAKAFWPVWALGYLAAWFSLQYKPTLSYVSNWELCVDTNHLQQLTQLIIIMILTF